MNYVKSLNILDEDVRQLPCILGKGAPTTATEGAVGEFYMDTDTGVAYKCVAATKGIYTWRQEVDEAMIEAALDAIIAIQEALIGGNST